MGMVRWAKKVYLRRLILKESRRQVSQMSKEDYMDFLKSKEQWINLLVIAASIIATVDPQAIAEWLRQLSDGLGTGSTEVVVGAIIAGVFAVSKFFSRLNRKKEVEEAVKSAMEKNKS